VGVGVGAGVAVAARVATATGAPLCEAAEAGVPPLPHEVATTAPMKRRTVAWRARSDVMKPVNRSSARHADVVDVASR